MNWNKLSEKEKQDWEEKAKLIPKTPIIQEMLVYIDISNLYKCHKHGFQILFDIDEKNKIVSPKSNWVVHLVTTHGMSIERLNNMVKTYAPFY